ncbi:MAG: AraC family transcriptional regulator [Planctomycetes bacterium]|nr:AraC family transcriptional regulator [Planctomycetota bacterium]
MPEPTPSWPRRLFAAFANPNVVSSEDLAWRPERAIDAHAHPFHQLDHFYGGTGDLRLVGLLFRVRPGDVFVSNPGDRHAFRSSRSDPLQGYSFKFRLPGRSVRVPNHVGNLSDLPASQQQELREHLRRACAEANGAREGHEELAGASLAAFLILLVRYLHDRDEVRAAPAQGTTSRELQEYLRRCHHLPLTLADLAHVADLNPRYLCRKFASETGTTPMAALAIARIEAAKLLLARTRLPMAEVGAQVGYPDLYHFSKRFKAIAGMAPTRWRERNTP